MKLSKRLDDLEGKGRDDFGGYAVVSSWDWPGMSKDEAVAAYIEASGPIPASKQAFVIGWGPNPA